MGGAGYKLETLSKGYITPRGQESEGQEAGWGRARGRRQAGVAATEWKAEERDVQKKFFRMVLSSMGAGTPPHPHPPLHEVFINATLYIMRVGCKEKKLWAGVGQPKPNAMARQSIQ